MAAEALTVMHEQGTCQAWPELLRQANMTAPVPNADFVSKSAEFQGAFGFVLESLVIP